MTTPFPTPQPNPDLPTVPSNQLGKSAGDGVLVTPGAAGLFLGTQDAASVDSPFAATAGYLVVATDDDGGLTIDLPETPADGTIVGVELPAAADAAVTVTTTDGSTINGAATYTLTAQYDAAVFVYADAAWTVLVKPSAGGSQPGASIVRGPFAIAFDTEGLVAGVPFYTPTAGDVLLDVWVGVSEVWDDTALLDIGTFSDTRGLFHQTPAGPLDCELGDSDVEGVTAGGQASDLQAAGVLSAATGADARRVAPAPFLDATPFKVVVSSNGRTTGVAPAANQGAATIYLVTATPVAFA